MLILHFSDLHCSTRNLERLLLQPAVRDVKVVVFTGDAECDSETVEILLRTGKRVFFVPGNMDDVAIAKEFDGKGMNIDSRAVDYEGYLFAGVGGLSYVSSIAALREKLRKLDFANRLVLISHHPPRNGVTDVTFFGTSAGLVELRALVLEFKPIVSLHGHIHEAPGFTRLGETLVVNPGPLKYGRYALVDLRTLTVKLERLEGSPVR